MAKVWLTKKFVIDALREELKTPARMRPESWLRHEKTELAERAEGTAAELRLDPDCLRCAVGAIALRVVTPRTGYYAVVDVARAATDNGGGTGGALSWRECAAGLAKTKPFAALSMFFESIWQYETPTPKRALEETIAFVEEHFPARVKFDADGAKVRAVFPRAR